MKISIGIGTKRINGTMVPIAFLNRGGRKVKSTERRGRTTEEAIGRVTRRYGHDLGVLIQS